MADNIQATPRNYLGGLLSDAYKWMQSPERTQQMQGFAGLLGTTGLPQTIERMAYGEPLTNIGRANVPLLKPETADALMTVAPMVGPAARGAEAGLLSAGRAGERLAERVVPQVMERGGLPAQLLGDLSQGSRRQIFVGKNSKSWNKDAEELALKMEKAGEKPEDIWMATGTFRGPEGKLRQEVSDTGAKLTLGNLKPDAYGAVEAKTFEGALEHPKLQQAYPQLNEVKFQHWPKEEYQGASFDPNDNVITMGQKAMEPERGVALHELQHAIQRQEGFAKGGSPSTVLNDWYAGINSKLSSLSKQMDALPEYERKFDKSKQSQYDVLRNKYDDLMNQKLYNAPDAEDAYFRLAGEAEARAVQKRMNFSDVQRRVVYPYESYDVKPSNLIVKNSDDISESKIRLPQEEALRLAQQRATLPVEQGGLGLLSSNTAAERAAAMGFNTPALHGSGTPDIKVFDPSLVGTKAGNAFDNYMWSTSSPEVASGYSLNPEQFGLLPEVKTLNAKISQLGKDISSAYSNKKMDEMGNLRKELSNLTQQKSDLYKEFETGKFVSEGSTIYPVLLKSDEFMPYEAGGKSWMKANRPAIEESQARGFQGVEIRNVKDNPNPSVNDIIANTYATENPDLIRSRFAAFDPFRKTAATAAAMGVAAPDLLAQQQPVITQQQIDDELAKYGLLGR
jgi:hypothetical protein